MFACPAKLAMIASKMPRASLFHQFTISISYSFEAESLLMTLHPRGQLQPGFPKLH
jgi:hypothetical protein